MTRVLLFCAAWLFVFNLGTGTGAFAGERTGPKKLLVKATATSTCADGCVGTAQVLNVLFATPPLTYQWSNGANTSGVSGLCAGAYTVTVTDAAGNTGKKTLMVSNAGSTPIVATESLNTCPGACNAAILAIPSGGLAPYNYLWNNGSTSFAIDNVCAGTYSVTVTDANGCQTVKQTTVTEDLSSLEVYTSDVPLGGATYDCYQSCDQVYLSAIGADGVEPYSYLWSNGETTDVAWNACPGNAYIVTVTDANGCTGSDYRIIGNLLPLTLPVPASCGSCDGYIQVADGGGTPPYSYAWSTGAVTNVGMLSGLCPGDYTVTVTDAQGCIAVKQATVLSSCRMIESEPTNVAVQVYPNPFTNELNIVFTLPANEYVTIELYSVLGQQISTLYKGHSEANVSENVSVGLSGFADGIYIYKLQ
ncbi:MAG TPA: T9SS type A sorting domain-containing protein, partial [Chitinophagales bacterium]|nr:T9SS type A sorting domain-containing protein [Chitinophagales bacterium]